MRVMASRVSRGATVAVVALAALVLLGLLFTVTPVATAQAATPDWLLRLNQIRAMAGLGPVVENTEWSYGCWLHARYMAENGLATHDEDPANPWYTPEGAAAGKASNCFWGASGLRAIDGWAAAPFHSLGMIDPRLITVGFGSYPVAAALNVISGRTGSTAGIVYPVMWPGPDSVCPFLRYHGAERPDPLSGTGYTAPVGLPIIVQFAATPTVTACHVRKGATELAHVVITETTYTNPDSAAQTLGRSVLASRHAVIIIPRDPLEPATRYTVSLSTTSGSCEWSFTTSGLADSDFTSIRGDHRYHTAQLISQALFPDPLPAGAGCVVAPGETFQEALCGAPLAAAYGGPVLLTTDAGLENGTRAELQRLQPDQVFCVGLSTDIVAAVNEALPDAAVTLIEGPATGASVYAMSRAVADALGTRVVQTGGDISQATAIITVGTNFPDAIGVSPLACAELWPVILTDQPGNGVLHPDAAGALLDLGITRAIKVGTYATLPTDVSGLANLSGDDRYYTNANVADWARRNTGLTLAHTAFATGDKFPDALAAGPYLAKDAGILFLSPLGGSLPDPVFAALFPIADQVLHVTFIACIEPVIGQVKALLQ